MRNLIIAAVVLSCASASVLAQATDKLKQENAQLQAENQALLQRVEDLTRRLRALQVAVRAKLQAELGMRELDQRLARLLDADAAELLASGDNPAGTDPLNHNRPNKDPFARLVEDASKPPTDPTRPPTDPAQLARVDPPKPVIPAPPTGTDPVRIRPRVERAPGQPTTIAVVDMVSVFNTLEEKERIEHNLGDEIYAVQFEDQTWQRRIRALQLDLELLNKGTEGYFAKEAQIEKAKIDWNVALAAAKTRLYRKRGALTRDLYEKMVVAVGRVADENGFDVVLFKEPEPAIGAETTVRDLATSRMVADAVESIDLSEQVIRLMNAEYRRQASK